MSPFCSATFSTPPLCFPLVMPSRPLQLLSVSAIHHPPHYFHHHPSPPPHYVSLTFTLPTPVVLPVFFFGPVSHAQGIFAPRVAVDWKHNTQAPHQPVSPHETSSVLFSRISRRTSSSEKELVVNICVYA